MLETAGKFSSRVFLMKTDGLSRKAFKLRSFFITVISCFLFRNFVCEQVTVKADKYKKYKRHEKTSFLV